MKNYLTLFAVCFAVLAVGLMHSCKKDSMGSNVYVPPPPPSPPPPPAITTNYSEEFSDYNEFVEKGWETSGYTTTNINTYVWTAGSFGATGKGDSVWYGFTAYSYTLYPTEYFYAYSPAVDSK
jgi:hypothetical protein